MTREAANESLLLQTQAHFAGDVGRTLLSALWELGTGRAFVACSPAD